MTLAVLKVLKNLSEKTRPGISKILRTAARYAHYEIVRTHEGLRITGLKMLDFRKPLRKYKIDGP